MTVPYDVYVVSARRPECVGPMLAALVPDVVHFAVPEANADGYSAQAANLPPEQRDRFRLVPLGDFGLERPLPAHRNACTDRSQAAGQASFQVSDDLLSLKTLGTDGKGHAATWPAVRDTMLAGLRRADLVGVPPTANPFYAKRRVNPWSFIIGDLYLTSATSEPRASLDIPLKEDYDLTCKHLRAYGRVARLDWLLAEFRHYSNPGGAVSYRNEALEDEVIARLLDRHGAFLKPHPKRAHEVLMRPMPAEVRAMMGR